MARFERLSDDHLRSMRTYGFVHITGLTAVDFKVGAKREIVIQAQQGQTSTISTNNDTIVMVTGDGQVWIARYNEDTYNDVCALAESLDIRQGRAFVPCTNGESIPTVDLLRRIADPYEDMDITVDRMFNPQPAAPAKGKLPNLPPSNLTIKNGQVVAVEEWTLWNLEPWVTIDIRRLGNGEFRASIGSPEHGGGSNTGTLDKALEGLHPNIAAWYRYIFSLKNLDPNISVQTLKQYQLKFMPETKTA